MQMQQKECRLLTILAITLSISPLTSIANTLIYEKNLEQYPVGFAVGGSLGKGYLSTHESNNINDNLAQPATAPTPSIGKGFNNGYFIWGAYAAYDFLFHERVFPGVAIGYQSLGKSTGFANSRAPITLASGGSGVITAYQYQQEQQAIDFLLTGRVYISEKYKGLHFLGKAGAAFVKASDRVSFSGTSQTFAGTAGLVTSSKRTQSSSNIWRIEPEFDLGLGYSFSRHLSAHILYTYIGGTDGNTSTAASAPVGDNIPWQGVFAYNAVAAGLSYSFG